MSVTWEQHHQLEVAEDYPAAIDALEARLQEDPDDVEEGADWRSNLNPNSLEVLDACRVEPSLAAAAPGSRYQLERLGYFSVDLVDSSPRKPVLNRTVSLRDTWAKIEKSQQKRRK